MKKSHNIAINNGKPVIGTDKTGNNGWYNSGNQGTIIWDAKNRKFLYKVLNNGWEVNKAVGHTNYWAQGGVSMSLGSTSWRDTMKKEKLPNPDDLDGSGSSQMRAYDNNNKLKNIKGDSRPLHQIITVNP